MQRFCIFVPAIAGVFAAGSASAAVVWSDDFSYGNDSAAMGAAGWDNTGYGSGYGVTAAERLWGNSASGMPALRASTGHTLTAGEDIDVTIDVQRTGLSGNGQDYTYAVEVFAWDGTTATSMGSTTLLNDGTLTVNATAAHAGQQLVFDFQHITTWGETNSISVDVVPEPASAALVGLGAFAVLSRRRR